MSDARSTILGRVHRALKTARVPVVDAGPVSAPAAVPASSLMPRFLAELKALGIETYVEARAEDVALRVAAIVGERLVLAWDAERLPYGVGAALPNALSGASPRGRQAAAEIGVTGCAAAIAETGSLALLSGPGQPRAASLLPPVHLAIVRSADLHATVGEFFDASGSAIGAAANCTFITGPSRTADIELTLTLGVHGPGQVIVVVGP